MHGSDPYSPRDDGPGELPELPLARPGEFAQRRAAKQQERAVAPPALGASFTAAGAGGTAPVPATDDLDETPPHDLQLMTWELAARLTAGMLANPNRSHASVKDAMGLFDQFLHEMHAYVRISEEFDLGDGGAAAERRRSHVEYFREQQQQQQHDDAGATNAPGADAASSTMPRPDPPLPAPQQPTPGADYRAIPPGLRGPYRPGSMGATPPVDGEGDDVRRAA